MAYAFSCPTCGKGYTARDNDAGKKAKCKKCGTSFEIPDPGDPVQCSCPECGYRFKIANELAGKTVLCPECKTRFKAKEVPDDEEEDEFEPPPPYRKPGRTGSRAGLWIGLGAGGFILILTTVGAMLWATGFFAKREAPGSPGRPSRNEATLHTDKRIPPPAPVVLTEKQKAAVADAIKALGRIQAATEVGVNSQQYGPLVIDAKAVVSEAEHIVPAGELLTNLTEAMQAYKDAATVWQYKFKCGEFYRQMGLREEFGHGAIIERYKLPLLTGVSSASGKEEQKADCDVAIQLMWAAGAKKLADARSLQSK